MLSKEQTEATGLSAADAALHEGYVKIKGTEFTITKKGLRAVRAWKHREPALSFVFLVRVREVISQERKEQGDADKSTS